MLSFLLFHECRQARARSRLAAAMMTVSGWPLALRRGCSERRRAERAITKPVSASCGRALGARLIRGLNALSGGLTPLCLIPFHVPWRAAASLALAACFWLHFPGPYTRPFPTHVHPLSTHPPTPSTHPPHLVINTSNENEHTHEHQPTQAAQPSAERRFRNLQSTLCNILIF